MSSTRRQMGRLRPCGITPPRPNGNEATATTTPTKLPAEDGSGTPPALRPPATAQPDVVLYTPEQAAAMLQVRPSWLRRRAAARTVPCRFLGKHLRFAREDIDQIAEASKETPRTPTSAFTHTGRPSRRA